MLWVVIGGAGKWIIKLPIVVVVPLFSFLVWSSLDSFTGWPANTTTPSRLMLIQEVVVEPSKTTSGAIYIWGIPPKQSHGLFKYRPKESEPRAYKLPYTRQLHEQVAAAQAAQKAGVRVAIAKSNKGEKDRGVYRFYILPQVDAPIKS